METKETKTNKTKRKTPLKNQRKNSKVEKILIDVQNENKRVLGILQGLNSESLNNTENNVDVKQNVGLSKNENLKTLIFEEYSQNLSLQSEVKENNQTGIEKSKAQNEKLLEEKSLGKALLEKTSKESEKNSEKTINQSARMGENSEPENKTSISTFAEYSQNIEHLELENDYLIGDFDANGGYDINPIMKKELVSLDKIVEKKTSDGYVAIAPCGEVEFKFLVFVYFDKNNPDIRIADLKFVENYMKDGKIFNQTTLIATLQAVNNSDFLFKVKSAFHLYSKTEADGKKFENEVKAEKTLAEFRNRYTVMEINSIKKENAEIKYINALLEILKKNEKNKIIDRFNKLLKLNGLSLDKKQQHLKLRYLLDKLVNEASLTRQIDKGTSKEIDDLREEFIGDLRKTHNKFSELKTSEIPLVPKTKKSAQKQNGASRGGGGGNFGGGGNRAGGGGNSGGGSGGGSEDKKDDYFKQTSTTFAWENYGPQKFKQNEGKENNENNSEEKTPPAPQKSEKTPPPAPNPQPNPAPTPPPNPQPDQDLTPEKFRKIGNYFANTGADFGKIGNSFGKSTSQTHETGDYFK